LQIVQWLKANAVPTGCIDGEKFSDYVSRYTSAKEMREGPPA